MYFYHFVLKLLFFNSLYIGLWKGILVNLT